MNRKNDVQELLPLTEPAQAILAVLSGRRLHGYEIMKQAKSDAGITIPTGTLYRNISKMLDSGLIAECDPPSRAAGDDTRRKFYKVTGLGERVLDAQIARHNAIAGARLTI